MRGKLSNSILTIALGCAQVLSMSGAAWAEKNRPSIGDEELGYVSARLTHEGTRRYQHALMRLRTKRGLKLQSVQDVEGVLLERIPEDLSPFGPFFHDTHGSWTHFGEDESGMQFAVTFFPGDTATVSVTDETGRVEAAIGTSLSGSRYAVLFEERLKDILPCLTKSTAEGRDAMGAFLGCARVASGRGKQSAGGATEMEVSGFVADYMEADCSEGGSGPMDMVSMTPEEAKDEAQRMRDAAAEARARAEEAMDRGDTKAAEDYKNAANHADASADYFEASGELVESEDVVVYKDMIDAALQQQQQYRRNYDRARSRQVGGRGGPNSQPGIDPTEPESPYHDPRCPGRTHGTFFLDPEFCGGTDMISCLRRTRDGVFGATGGVCWESLGPDDGQLIQCEPDESTFECLEERSPLECLEAAAVPEDDAGPGDDIMGPGTGGGSPEVGDYVDMTPLGGLLGALCAIDDCGGPVYTEHIEMNDFNQAVGSE